MEVEKESNEYFSSYEDLEVHRLMLEDEPRTLAYQNAILSNEAYFKDKVVMDVGCGTGILSIFCAQAGAKKVYAVEASDLANLAKEVVKENGFDEIIEVIHSRVEDVILPDNMKVDAIISEWMGFYLLHEGMLDSVIAARDKFLKDGGEMFPESATIYIAPCSIPSLYDKWDNLYGVSMSTFAKCLRQNKSNKPEILNVKPADLLGPQVALCWINLKENKMSDLDKYSIQHVVGARKSGFYQGLCVWFECKFPGQLNNGENGAVVLDTSPESPATHWKQTVIVLPHSYEVEEGDPIAFQLDMTRDAVNRRRYNLQVTILDPETVDHPLPCTCHMTRCILIKIFMEQQAEKELETHAKYEGNVIEDEDIDEV
ncbi:hypothetical protein K1T71_010325 [Dendrolimus kikuchii]|uniref:Uncharacterized protein n=1 Tax=Dendrolimus kikuchii TaxID=765133 RepID=A0ACC1CR74_9NEOP|nr:hypothetical protein K1T71_010325 [Dendrolimus kikuchii]